MKYKLFLLLIMFSLLLLTGCKINIEFNGIRYGNASEYSVLDEKEIEGLNEVTRVEINWVSGSITINNSEEANIKEENSGNYPLYYRIKDGKLTIQFCENETKNKDIKNLKKDLTISLNTNKYDIEINNVSSSLDVLLSDVNKFNLDNVSGSGIIALENSNDIIINNVSGNLDLKVNNTNELKTIDIDNVSGNFNIYLNNESKLIIDFDSVNGKLHNDILYLEGTHFIYVDIDTVSGSFYIKKINSDNEE